MKIKAIHFSLDEKFIDLAIDQFNEIPEIDCRYLVLLDKNKIKAELIKSQKIEVFTSYRQIEQILFKENYDVLFLHSMRLSPKTILKISEKIKIVWFSWGWDIYRDINDSYSFSPIKLQFYKNQTKKILKGKEFAIRQILRYLYAFTFNSFVSNKLLYKKSIQRIDFCSTVIPPEFDALENLSYFKAKKFNFIYQLKGFFDLDEADDLLQKPCGNNILLGNSSTASGNHADVFENLKNIDLKNRKVYVPLSYGDMLYRKKILSTFQLSKNKNIIPLLDFLPKDEYYNIMNGCSNVIMGHIRQQAMGNVYVALDKGCKLFLYKDSLVYKYLTAEGYHLFSIDDDLNDYQLDTFLTNEQILHNRKLLAQVFSSERVKRQLVDSVKALMKEA